MNSLNEKQIEYIIQMINKSKIKSDKMKEDLIDHFCCAIEEYMKKDMSFEESYNKAYKDICPNGLDEIQNETTYLLISKKFKAMKRLLYLSGYLSAIGITTTLIMKLNHLPGGAIALLFTVAVLIFLFLPALFVYLYRRSITKSSQEKMKYIFGFLGIALLILAVFFKFAHYPGTIILFTVSLVIINFIFFPLLFFKMYRKIS